MDILSLLADQLSMYRQDVHVSIRVSTEPSTNQPFVALTLTPPTNQGSLEIQYQDDQYSDNIVVNTFVGKLGNINEVYIVNRYTNIGKQLFKAVESYKDLIESTYDRYITEQEKFTIISD